MSIFNSMAEEFSSNITLMIGILFLAISFLLSLLSIDYNYRILSIPAAIMAIFGAILAIKGYMLFLKKVQAKQHG